METEHLLMELEDMGIDAVIEATVRNYGTGAHISIPRKFLNQRVKIFILKD